jgi:glycerophosphoryl diester phosphodiesterase
MLKIGHRGACGYVAENTIESIEKALSLEADGVEFDIFKCKSGELVLFHDKTLKNLVGRPEKIEELSLKELDNCLIKNKYSIPTLDKVLEKFSPPFFLNIELKGVDTAISTSNIIKDYVARGKWKASSFIVSSFDWHELEMLRRENETIPIGVLIGKTKTINEAIEFGNKINAQSIHPYFSILNEKNVKKIKNNKFKVFAWTVNKKKDIKNIKKLNVDGIISSFPDRI